jgi:prolyl-tRNA synthetase
LAPVARVKLDDRDKLNPGAKYYEWEGKGVPIRVEIGPKDVANKQVMVVRRFVSESGARKTPIAEEEALASLPAILDSMQNDLLEAALKRREESSYRNVSDYEEFKKIINTTGGFIYTGFCGAEECEQQVKDDTKATIRAIPDDDFRSEQVPDHCICGGKSQYEVVWARAY